MTNTTRIQLYADSLTPSVSTIGFLETSEKTNVPLNFAIADIRDISKKKGAFSKSITIPGTKNNNRLLNNYFDVNVQAGTFDINKLQRCAIIQDGNIVLDNAILQLVSVNKEEENGMYVDNVTYTVLVKDNTADFFTLISNKYLTDIDFSEFDHEYNWPEIVQSFDNTVVDGYKYVLPYNTVDGYTNDANYNLTEFTPAIYLKQYWDRIFYNSGYSYSFPTMDDNDLRFSNLIIPYNGDVPKVGLEESSKYRAEAITTATATYNNTIGLNLPSEFPQSRETIQSSTPTKVLANSEIYDPASNYNTTTSTYTTPELTASITNNLKVRVTIDYDVIVDNTGIAQTAFLKGKTVTFGSLTSLPPNATLTIAPKLIVKRNNSTVAEVIAIDNSDQIRLSSNYTIAANTSQVIRTASLTKEMTIEGLSTEEDINVWVENMIVNSSVFHHWRFYSSPLIGSTATLNTKIKLQVKSCKVEYVSELNGDYGWQVPLKMNKFIPQKVKQSEFVKSILTMFNLYVEVDKEVPNRLNIFKRNEYYDAGAIKDWTDKLVKEKTQEIKFIPEVINKRMLFTYKEDSDWANKNYLEATKEIYGQAEFIFDNEYVKDTTKQELIFSPTPVANTLFGAVTPIWNGQAPKNNIRILYDGGIYQCNQYKIFLYGNQDPALYNWVPVNAYPHISHWDKPVNPTFDLNWLACDYYFRSDDYGSNTVNNLFNLHWRRTVNQINNGKFLTAYFTLNSNDIAGLKLNDKIRIDNSWWNINKIQDYDANSKQPTKVELISVDDFVEIPFIERDTIRISRGNPAFSVLNSLAKDKVPYLNTVLTDGVVNVQGRSNYITAEAGDTSITGNFNTVSAQSNIVGDFNFVESPSIVHGTQNVVPEGIQNVLILGNNYTASVSDALYTDNIVMGPSGSINGVSVNSITDQLWSSGTTAQSIKQKNTIATATGIRALSVGQGIGLNGSIASGQDSIAFAGGNASGLRSFAHGISAAASGQDSIAFTAGSASGLNSFSHAGSASGSLASSFSGGAADGGYSHAVGDGALAQTYSETVVGINASSITGNSGAFAAADPAFRVGNGASNVARSDAFRVYKHGAAYLKPITPGSIASPVTGMMAFDSSTNDLKIYNGTAWVTVGSTNMTKELIFKITGSSSFTTIKDDLGIAGSVTISTSITTIGANEYRNVLIINIGSTYVNKCFVNMENAAFCNSTASTSSQNGQILHGTSTVTVSSGVFPTNTNLLNNSIVKIELYP